MAWSLATQRNWAEVEHWLFEALEDLQDALLSSERPSEFGDAVDSRSCGGLDRLRCSNLLVRPTYTRHQHSLRKEELLELTRNFPALKLFSLLGVVKH